MSKVLQSDVAIVGGGMVGLSTAIGLARAGMSVTVVDRLDAPETTAPAFDGRASAIAYASVRMLEALDIWQHMAPHAQPILEIRVSDGTVSRGPGLLHLHFDHRDMKTAGSDPDGPLGHMVENRFTRIALFKALDETPNVRMIAPDTVETIHTDKTGTALTLGSGQRVEAALLLGIDGRQSQVRAHAGIPSSGCSYKQTGIVCAIAHDCDHLGIAHEKFLPSGPFAILPLKDRRASLVWSEKARLAETIMGLSERAFEAEVRRRVGDFLGEVRVTGGRWSYPLSMHVAHDFIAERTALVGDSAHGIHPIAGQGLNLGLRDAAALIEVLAEAHRLGLDPGGAETLKRYQTWRRSDTVVLAGIMDGLTRLFSNDSKSLRLARGVGLSVVDRIPPLKRFFISHARGTVGTLPKLLTGETPA